MSGFDLEIREEKKTWKMALMWAVVVYAVLAAIFSAYFSVFEVGIESKYMMGVLGMTIPIPMIVLWNQKYRFRNIIGAFLSFILVSIILYEKVYAGFSPFINRYIELYNKYYVTTMTMIIVEEDLWSKLLVLWLLGTIFATILIYGLVTKRGMILSVAVILTPVIISAIVGKMPVTISCWGLISSACFYIVAYHHRYIGLPYREWTSVAFVLVILFAVSSVISPVITDYKNDNIEKYEEIRKEISESQQFNLEQLKESVSSLKNRTSFNPTGEAAMEIILTEKPLQTIYLKAFVGSKYTGESWEEIGTFEFSDMISPIGGAAKRRTLMNEPFRRVNDGTSDYSVKHMEISLVNASSEFAYTPYYAQITDDYDVHLDSYVEGGWLKKREYDCYTETPMDFSMLAEPSELWIRYQDFVEKTYVGEYEELEQLNELCQDLDNSSTSRLSSEIYQMFQEAFRYSRNPGAMPDDADFIEGFLFQRKTGFCVHFATAATLIYQISGVPARYVEGYCVSPDQFTRYQDGTYRAVVTDEDAHAWCEIFNEEIGWYPKEFTPSSDVSDANLPDVEDYIDSNEEIQEENPPQDNEQDESQNDMQQQEKTDSTDDNKVIVLPGDEKGGTDSDVVKIVKGFLLKCGAVIFVILFLLLLMVLQHRVRRRRKLKSFRQRKENRGILKMYNEIYELCIFAGLKVSEESEKEKVKNMSETFSIISEEEWSWIYNIAEKSAFSGKVFSAEEQKKMYHLYQKLRLEILKNLNWRKKVWFIYGKVM